MDPAHFYKECLCLKVELPDHVFVTCQCYCLLPVISDEYSFDGFVKDETGRDLGPFVQRVAGTRESLELKNPIN